MIRTADILLSVCKQLRKKEDWDNYEILIDEKTTDELEDTNEETLIKNPCFSVQIDMLSSTNRFKLREKLINVYIYYINPQKGDGVSENKLLIMDELTELFDSSIKINNSKYVPIFRKDYLDNNNTFKMTIKYIDDKSEENRSISDVWDELMEVIKIKYIVKGERD